MPAETPPRTNRGRRPSDPHRATSSSAQFYPPREDTFLLLPFAGVDAGSSFLDIGTGSGLLALAAARRGARVVATDLNPGALLRLAAIGRAERLDLQVVRTDLARGLGRFDRVLANPPYLPTRPSERDPDRWHNLALDGGPDGCATTARVVASLAEHLRPNGSGFVLASTVQSPRRLRAIWDAWRGQGGVVRRVASQVLEGERIEVYRFRRRQRGITRPIVPRTTGRRRGTGVRRRTPKGRPSA
jgi:HemK-related putative methylase